MPYDKHCEAGRAPFELVRFTETTPEDAAVRQRTTGGYMRLLSPEAMYRAIAHHGGSEQKTVRRILRVIEECPPQLEVTYEPTEAIRTDKDQWAVTRSIPVEQRRVLLDEVNLFLVAVSAGKRPEDLQLPIPANITEMTYDSLAAIDDTTIVFRKPEIAIASTDIATLTR